MEHIYNLMTTKPGDAHFGVAQDVKLFRMDLVCMEVFGVLSAVCGSISTLNMTLYVL